MKIVWLADYGVKDHHGGAQQTNELMIQKGRELGHEIEEITIKNYHRPETGSFVILNNVRMFWETIRSELLWMIDNTRYVRYEHDYLFDFMEKDFALKMFRQSVLNVFLSPLHFETNQTVYHNFKLQNVFIQPSPIDTSKFNTDGYNPEENSVLYCGSLSGHKGIENLVEYAKDSRSLKFTFVGWKEGIGNEVTKDLPSNCECIDPIPHKDISDFYKKFEYFIHLPLWNEPFGRTVMEAFLCNCELIVDFKKIGCLSFDEIVKPVLHGEVRPVKEFLEKAPANFWEKIDAIY